MMEKQLKILYEDADIIVCVKPAGIASQTKRCGQQDIVSLLCNYLHAKGEEPYVGIVHRLDQPVEGILVFGKHAKSTAQLNRQLTQGGFTKMYLAVTQGEMPLQEGELVDYLKKDGRGNVSAVAKKTDPQAKRAQLQYKVIKTDDSCHPVRNLVKIKLLTGRHHQIRVQMAHFGAPLAGDTKYGAPVQCEDGTASGIGLCACALEFVHPVSKKAMKFEIEPTQPVFLKFGTACKK